MQLSPQTWKLLAGRPRQHALVRAVWDRLDELGRTGVEHRPELVAALRFVLIHHQPEPGGRCTACRRQPARQLWRRRPWPCVVWLQVHYELIGPFPGGAHHRNTDE